MDFESPDVEKDFPGLYASESGKKSNESDFSDDNHERISRKELLIGKRKDKKDSKKDRGYATLEGESSPEEDSADVRSPSKAKKSKPFKFPSKKEKREKSREKDNKEKDVEKEKDRKKDLDKDKDKEKKKEGKIKLKSSKDRRKLKHGDENCDIGEEQPIFGVSLSLALERSRCHDGVEIPLVVRDCIIHIEENGLSTEGIYKISGMKSKVQHVRRLYNQRESVKLSDYDLPVATSLLKLFLRELPESVLTNKLCNKFEEASGIRDIATRGVELSTLLKQLPSCNVQLLSWIVKHLVSVTAHEKQNKMSPQSLSQILSQPLQMSQRLLASFMYHSDLLFSDTKLTKYIPPLTSSSGDLPETVEEITEELRKQESLLGQIHSEMNAGYVTKEREELLWEVQRMITQLKRKLRSLEKEAGETHHTGLQKIQSTVAASSSVTDSDAVFDNTTETITMNISHHHPPNSDIVAGCVTSVTIATNSATILSPSVTTNAMTIAPSNLVSDVVNNNNGNGGTKHVVEAVIENVVVDGDGDDVEDDDSNDVGVDVDGDKDEDDCVIGSNVDNYDDKNGILPSQTFASIVKDTHSHDNNGVVGNMDPQVSADEIALRLETEELLALVAQLQSQLEQEKANVACLRSEIRNLGGSPSFCDYLLESCSKDVNGGTVATAVDVASAADEQNSVVSFLRQVKAESYALQVQKKNLTASIIEGQESIARLRVQVKMFSLNKACSVDEPATGSFPSGVPSDSIQTALTSASDCLQTISSPAVAV